MTTSCRKAGPAARTRPRLLTIRALGAFEVLVDDRPVTRADWQRVSAERLVKLLVVVPGHRVRREVAATVLWPDGEPDSVRASFRKALLFAGRALGDRGLIAVDADSIRLDLQRLDLDLDRLESAYDVLSRRTERNPEAAVVAHALDTVLELGWEELLPDDRFEDWLVSPRERLRDRWQRMALQIAEGAASRGEVDRALGILARALDLDPTDEAAHRLAIDLYARQGRHHAARRQLELCRRALREELDAEPAPETIAALAAVERDIRSGDVVRRAPRLVGRGPELQRLEEGLDLVGSGRAAAMVIHGPAGIGKTRLLEEVLAYAQAAGWPAAWLRPIESSRATAYGVLRAGLMHTVSPSELDALDEPGAAGSPRC